MAVQKSKLTRSKRGMRRSHDKLKFIFLSKDPISNETHIRHCITKSGFYKGKKYLKHKKNTK
ncbi:50S ribosomal protein L32 [Buchnera aphidicola]|uniref:Large ribosomal subunit protein bL32 n=1 Tax=Buchnera aphidicola (Stegophylla sp.) TaxID=2315800 RepID=A0A4D6YL78_9GAMM|nr:50S ribosomal protein L32 [Buchnera aphidicola (Stegophylla sp.)]QCI26388.1 50S ribosomal protein L32 [Buchnera aphidicola (Stegophylla sp.)]